MEIDPVVVALGGAITTMAGVLFRELVKRAERAEADAAEWEARYFRQVGMTDLAIDETEKRGSS